jgi:hypothetical protein
MGLKIGQLALSMGPARAEVCSYVQRATIPSNRVIPYMNNTFISTTHAIIFYVPYFRYKKYMLSSVG